MKKQNIFLYICISILFLASLMLYRTHAEQGDLTFQIKGVGIRHGTPDNANLGMLNTSINDQEISGQFTDYFRVEDLEGYITGHYTTVQCDGVYGPAGYKLTGVYLKAGNTSPVRLLGNPGNVLISSGLYNYASILDPVTYIYKPTGSGNAGIVNRYGDKPWLKIIIPGYTPPGTYSGTIVFSFYMY